MLLVSGFKRIAGSMFGEFYFQPLGLMTIWPILLPCLLIFGKIW
jgi:hypothetical protein